jgi:hypothetical protein
MRYMMMFYETPADFAQRTHPTDSGNYWGAWSAYIKALNESGFVQGGAGLQPPETSTTIRLRDDRRQVQDGPFADSKEQLAGYFVLEAPDLDAVLHWAARSPCATTGAVEIRPTLPPMGPPA